MPDGIDAGLDELTSDVLGPTAEPSTDTAETDQSGQAVAAEEQSPVASQEPAQAQPDPTQSGQPVSPVATPTAQVAPQTIEIDGVQYTPDQIRALKTTAQQFGHLQKKWTEAKPLIERAQQQQTTPAQPLDPKTVQRQIRASFDSQVESAVKDGFMEADFAALYPDVAAGMVMYRDTIAAVANVAAQLRDKVTQYEQQIAGERVVGEIKNNMAALSTQHAAFAPLADATVREQFFEYLVQVDPKVDQLQDPQFLIGHWVAFKRNDFLSQAPAQARVAQQVQAQRQVQRRQAVADAVGGSRPAPVQQVAKTPLDEMVDDMFDRSR